MDGRGETNSMKLAAVDTEVEVPHFSRDVSIAAVLDGRSICGQAMMAAAAIEGMVWKRRSAFTRDANGVVQRGYRMRV
jgi:hypothetical protein